MKEVQTFAFVPHEITDGKAFCMGDSTTVDMIAYSPSLVYTEGK